jgi:hypothetical protein
VHILAWGFSLALTMATADGRAEARASDEAEVNDIFKQAREAYLAGDYATACPKFKQVVERKPGLGARLALGDCYRQMGKPALAWEVYESVAADAPTSAARADKTGERETARKRAEEASARMTELAPKLAWLKVVVPEALRGVEGLEVARDGDLLPAAQWDKPRPIEPGAHRIQVFAPGKKPWQRKLEIDAPGREESVAVPPLEEEPMGVFREEAPPLPPPPQPPPAKADTTGAARESRLGAQRIAGIAVGAAGLAAGGVGLGFGALALAKRNQSEAAGHCNGNLCDDVGFPLRAQSYRAGNVSTVLLLVGGVAFAGGVTLFLTAPHSAKLGTTAVVVGPGSVGLAGRF